MRKVRGTKIVATLGPASDSPEIIDQLCRAGVNVFRLNFSHGDHAGHRNAVLNIRKAEQKIKHPIAIMLDLQGPKLRVGTFKKGYVPLQVGQTFQLDSDPTPGDETRVYFGHPQIFPSLVPGANILINDGKVFLCVTESYPDHTVCVVQSGTEISDRKGVNLPNVGLDISSMTPKDDEDLAFGLELGIDWVAISFVQTVNDILRARAKVPSWVRLVAKIEKPLALQNLEPIIDASDGIMVARGDLGVEVPLEQVPGFQKRIVKECQTRGKPVIVATQMLDSMIVASTPTRAEVSDVASAVYDGADAVMLSAESASGKYPVQAVQMMDRIIRQVESDPEYTRSLRANLPFDASFCTPITSSVRDIVERSEVPVIVTVSLTGKTALRISRERPNAAIVTLAMEDHAARALCLVWGVYSYCVPFQNFSSLEEWIQVFKKLVLKENLAAEKDQILVVAGYPFGIEAHTNFASLLTL
ncbi:pyruvate kinase [Alphaproteobacteria bacterium]|nr:pyruvate kinase [Alphaproteobacteria bacterium]GHS98281.1 pyruvate kinase [Alphaproteobacteria bacterium]